MFSLILCIVMSDFAFLRCRGTHILLFASFNLLICRARLQVPHKYDDKYALAEFVTNCALAAQFNVLELLGLSDAGIKRLKEWSKQRTVTLRFTAEERCTYLREETRKVESGDEYVTEVDSSVIGRIKRTFKTVRSSLV